LVRYSAVRFENSATAYATPQSLKGVNEHRR
jgi:hypothetical protein